MCPGGELTGAEISDRTPRDMAAPSTANLTTNEQRVPHPSRLEQDGEPGPDLSILKEIGRKALIDSLNSVRFN